MKLHYIILSITLMSVINFAQPYDDPMKFFPTHTGNMWEYFYYDSPYSDTLQLFNTKDSIDLNGIVHLWQSSGFINPPKPPVLIGPNYYKIDQYGEVEGYWESYRGILFKLSANQGDKWVLKEYNQNAFEMIRVDTVFESSLFGINTQIKKYRRYFTDDSAAITGTGVTAKYLAYNLGIVHVDGLEGLGSLYLKGAVINGILYGDTTKIITSVVDINHPPIFEDFFVHQNYPNPFNSETNIHFIVESSTTLSIKVYDILGNEIRSFVENKDYYPGFYKINWDGKDNFSKFLTSGIYFYKIYNNKKSSFKKMILLK